MASLPSVKPLSDRKNIVVIADEAHRSQYGLAERIRMSKDENGETIAQRIVGAARRVRNSLPNATYIGFTGTPISQKDRSTQEVFGNYIDIYDMTQAVEDGATRPDRAEKKEQFLKEALMLHQALSLCASLVPVEQRYEAAFFEAVRVLTVRLTNQGNHKKLSLPELNAKVNDLLKQSVKSEGVINLFSDIKEEFSLFDPKFLDEISKMKEKNLAIELLKKLIAAQRGTVDSGARSLSHQY